MDAQSVSMHGEDASSQLCDEDWVLIQRFRDGDTQSFEVLFNKYKARVIRLAFRFVQRQELAEDIAQEVFLKIYEKKLPTQQHAKFFTWLYRVTVNAALDVVRRNKWVPRSLDEPIASETEPAGSLQDILADPNAPSPREVLQQQELQAMVQHAVDRLPAKLRTPLLLYQFEQLTYAEISQVLGLSEKAVERRLYYAREHLRKLLSIL